MKGLVMRRLLLFFAVALLASFPVYGQSTIEGGVFEQDGSSPIEGAEIHFAGFGLQGDTLDLLFYSDSLGYYGGEINAGLYFVSASAEGYETNYLADSLLVEDGQSLSDIDFVLFEICHPVRYVAARHFATDLVRLSWSMNEPLIYEDFESGDFSRFSWNNSLSEHPWAIDSIHACEGQYCMKSSCEGVDDGLSAIEVSVYVPLPGQMAFFSKVSSESPWDVGRFYLDGTKLMECSGDEDWAEHRFDITAGEHLFRWTYAKDASTNDGDDCFYVDGIRFFVDDSTELGGRSFQYFDLFRRRFDEAPVMLASHLTDTVFMEMNWNSLPWGRYQWGISCYYEGNRGVSDTVWSEFLDKEMATFFELSATTNVDVVPAGATVWLSSHEGYGHTYEASLDGNGRLLLDHVYRDTYDLLVRLDGFMDYASAEPIAIFEPTQIEIELRELTDGIDSLYVSSTGWAIWHLADGQNRDLQFVELMLDDEVVCTTTSPFYQFNVSGLEEGTTYVVQARAVYLSGASQWHSCEWTYRSCSGFEGSTNGLVWAILGEAVQLSWNYPENEGVLGAMLFRDGVFLAFTDEESFMDLTVEMHNEVNYCLRLVYDGTVLDGSYFSMSCEECTVAVFPTYCDPPVKLEAENFLDANGEYGALVSWGERPEPINQWLRYDDGTFETSLGSASLIFWSVRFDVEDLADYVGASLKKVSLYDVGAGNYQLWVYVGGDEAPRTPVRSQNMTMTGSNAWHEENIVPALEIPDNEPIWIVVGQQGLNRPAAACSDMGNPNGRWVSLDGIEWVDMHYFNMYYTWMIRAFVTNRDNQSLALGEDGYVLQNYNLYRAYDNANYQQIAAIPAVEGQPFYQYRDYLMEDGHQWFYYRLTALYLSDDGETCESDFANSLNHPENNFVWVDDHWALPDKFDDDARIYPNPASDVLFVEGRGEIESVMVFNVLGQKVLETSLSANAHQLQLTGLLDGLYWLRVETQNGVAVRRFVVRKN